MMVIITEWYWPRYLMENLAGGSISSQRQRCWTAIIEILSLRWVVGSIHSLRWDIGSIHSLRCAVGSDGNSLDSGEIGA